MNDIPYAAPDAMALVRKRARNLLLFGSASAIAIGVAATQFAAWRLNYDPVLGAPVIAHAYWPWRFIEWWQAPWEPQVAQTFNIVKLGLMGTLCAGLLGFTKLQRKQPKPQPTIHGTARFATEAEIRASGLLPPKGQDPRPGIIVGGFPRRRGAIDYLTYANAGHVLCLGPTRSGKSAGVILPTLLTWPHSTLIYDPKGELWKQSAGWRHSEARNTVLRFAPAELDNTIAWNPFSRVRTGTPFEFRDVANIIAHVADPHGQGPTDHWEPSAANLLVGVALFLGNQRTGCTLTGCLAMIDGPAGENGAQPWLTAMAQHPMPQIAQVGNGMLATAARERASIISTARRLLSIYRDPVVARNTSRSDVRVADLMDADQPVSLYIETRGEDELRLRPLVRLFLSLAIGQLISNDKPHRHPLIAAIDEVAALGKMEPLELMLAKSAGSDVYGLLLTQDRADILAAYGPNERITANCHVLIAHAPNNRDTARWLSDKTGQTTVVTEEVSEAQNSGSQRSQNRSYRSVARPVLTPDEVSRLRLPVRDAEGQITAPGEVLIFQAGEHVIRGVQSLYFLDPEYRRRSAIPAPETMRAVPRSPVVDMVAAGPLRTVLS